MMLTCAGLALGAAAVAAGTIRPDRRPSPRAAPTERERPA
jgi:hypothetical protein